MIGRNTRCLIGAVVLTFVFAWRPADAQSSPPLNTKGGSPNGSKGGSSFNFFPYKVVLGGAGAQVPMADNTGTPLPAYQLWNQGNDPSYNGGNPQGFQYPGAAVMGSTVTVAISDQGPAGGFNGTLNVTSCTYGGAAVPCSPSSVSCTVAQKGSVTLTFSVGPLPSSVSTAEPLSITLQGTYNGNTYTGAGAGCNVYLLYQTPTAPMTTPWLDVVDDGCTWAYGDNTAAQVARDETLGLYNSGYFQYQYTSGFTTPMFPTVFKLTTFLGEGAPSLGNCVDVSDYLTIVENSQGLSFNVQQFAASPFNSNSGFTTNPICPIGDVGFGTLASWVFHQLAFSGGNAFDACAAEQRDLVGNIYKQPPYNWPWQGLWETPQPGGGGTYSYGLVATPLDANGMNTPNPNSSTLPVQGQYTPTVQ